jgi:hypothetical protein
MKFSVVKRGTLMAVMLGALVAASQAAAERTVCMSGTGGCEIRPNTLPYGAHASLRRIQWPSWGGARAVGYGSIKWGATVTEPAYGPVAAKIILSEVAECQGRLWYSRRSIKIGRHHGRTIENNEAFGPCYYP